LNIDFLTFACCFINSNRKLLLSHQIIKKTYLTSMQGVKMTH